jgi:4-aminobutyrate aminotransferase-like enzyme
MSETISYSELIQFVSDPSALVYLREGFKVPVRRAGGVYLYTTNDLRVMDFTAGINGINIGHNHPRVLGAAVRQIREQAGRAGRINNDNLMLQLKAVLSGTLPPGVVSISCCATESEAVQFATRTARVLTKRSAVIHITIKSGGLPNLRSNGFQIKTEYRYPAFNLDPSTYFVECTIPDRHLSELSSQEIISELLSSFRDLFHHPISPSKVSAVIVDLGENKNGFFLPPVKFLNAVRYFCDQNGILLIFNEGLASIGRTGTVLAVQTLGLYPDLMIIGKGLANGFSLTSVVRMDGGISGLVEGHLNGFEPTPISLAAALATLNVIHDENLLSNCRMMGARLFVGLQALQKRFPTIGNVWGAGLNLTLELIRVEDGKTPDPAAALDLLCFSLEHGLLAHRTGSRGQAICLTPPLNVTEDQIDRALYILEQGLSKERL